MYFNTSNVTIQLNSKMTRTFHLIDFNTSNVTIQLNSVPKTLTAFKFQYI